MTTLPPRSPLALVVPFHNEERHLPKLIASLRAQRRHGVPIVFVDNASRDGSRRLLDACEELRAGTWQCLDEPRVGKFHAMKAGTVFCAERFGARWVSFLDADAYCADADWLATCAGIVAAQGGDLGYVYAPFRYDGIEHLATFARAYAAYQSALIDLVTQVGWLANGQGFVAAADVLERYFARAQVTTEIDLRVSLLALHEGRRGHFHAGLIVSSPRRTLVHQANFTAWCFYEPDFYTRKDINAAAKLSLDGPALAGDLRPEDVGRFFARRALKLVARHLMPLVLFDRSSDPVERIGRLLDIELSPAAFAALREHARPECLFGAGFEAMVGAIEAHPVGRELARRIERRMQDRHLAS
jgi:hypothetical protein